MKNKIKEIIKNKKIEKTALNPENNLVFKKGSEEFDLCLEAMYLHKLGNIEQILVNYKNKHIELKLDEGVLLTSSLITALIKSQDGFEHINLKNKTAYLQLSDDFQKFLKVRNNLKSK
jgi:hypothetical protein